jgi:hypothetical protein
MNTCRKGAGMKKILIIAGCLITALVLGAASAFLAIKYTGQRGWVTNGAWRTNPSIGSENLDMYSKANVALISLMSLNRSEAVYYYAETDDNGAPLTAACVYRIEGGDIDARWWSVTVYGSDQYLIKNGENRFSFNRAILRDGRSSRYTVRLSSTSRIGNWIPTGDEKRLYLFLRIYNPGSEVLKNPASVRLPRIIKEGCR